MATPTLVQHISSGMENNTTTTSATFTIPLPNTTLSNNCLILGIQYASVMGVTSVKDSAGNSFTAGPTFTNSTYGQVVSCYYLPNCASGLTGVSVVFNGGTAVNTRAQFHLSEWYNIATTSPADGSSTASASKSAGSFTPSTSGDLIWHYGVDLSDQIVSATTVAFIGTSITRGSGFTLMSADLQVGVCAQYQVQTTAAAINPTFTTSGAATWGSLAIAFKSASSGTAPSSSSMRVVSRQHTYLCGTRQSTTTPAVLSFPSRGNLLVGLYTAGNAYISSITDSASNSWKCYTGLVGISPDITSGGVGQIVFAPNPTTSNTLGSITFTLNTSIGTSDANIILYDIVNADTVNPLASAVTTGGSSTHAADGGTLATVKTPVINSGSLAMAVLSVQWNTFRGCSTTGAIFDACVNSTDNNVPAGTNPSNLDEDNGFAHVYTTSTSSLTFNFTYTGTQDTLNWGSAGAVFNASGQTGNLPVLIQGPVNATSTSGTTLAATFLNNTTTGNTLLAITTLYAGATLRTVSSYSIVGGSATFAAVVSQAGVANTYGNTAAWAAPNITGGATPAITGHWSGAVTSADLVIYELGNMPSSTTADGTAGKAGSGSSMSTNAITTANNNDIIFAAFSVSANGVSGEAGWTYILTTENLSVFEYEVVNSTQTALSATGTQSVAGTYGAIIFALEGVAPPQPPLRVQITGTITTSGAVPPRLPLRPNLTGITGTILSSGVTRVSFTPVRVTINATIGVTWNGIFRVPIYPKSAGISTIVGNFQTKTAQRAPINAVTNVTGGLTHFGLLYRPVITTGKSVSSGAVNVRFANVLRPTAIGSISSSGFVHGTVKVPNLIIVTGAITARVNERTQIVGTISTSGLLTLRLTGTARIPITGLITSSGIVQPHLMGQIVLPTAIGTITTSGIVHVSLVTGVVRPTAIGTIVTSGIVNVRFWSRLVVAGNMLLFSAVNARFTQHFPITGLTIVTGTTLNTGRVAYPKAFGFISLLNTVLNPREVGIVRMPITGFIGLLNTYLEVGIQPTRIVLNSKVIAIFSTVITPHFVSPVTPPPFVGVGMAGYYVVLDAAGLFTILYMVPGVNYIYAAKTVLYGPFATYQSAFPQLMYAFQNLNID